SELSVQRLFLPHPLWAQAANGFYAVVHVPALIVFLLWMYFRHPTQYAKWRNVGAVLTGACLLIQMVPVAPPRLAPQLAAMPSVHVGWAVFIAVAVILVSPSRWRWLVLAHPALTALAVVATAN